MESNRIRGKDRWDKAQAIGSLLGSVLLPIALAYFGYAVSIGISRRERQAEYVHLCTEILRGDPTTASKPGLRLYAYNVLRDLSPYPIPPELEVEMLGTPLVTDSPGRKPASWTSARGGLASFFSGPDEAYVVIDGTVRAKTPASLELPGKVHNIEFKSPSGATLAKSSMTTGPDSLSLAVCNSLKETCFVGRVDLSELRTHGMDSFFRLPSRHE